MNENAVTTALYWLGVVVAFGLGLLVVVVVYGLVYERLTRIAVQAKFFTQFVWYRDDIMKWREDVRRRPAREAAAIQGDPEALDWMQREYGNMARWSRSYASWLRQAGREVRDDA